MRVGTVEKAVKLAEHARSELCIDREQMAVRDDRDDACRHQHLSPGFTGSTYSTEMMILQRGCDDRT